MNEAGWVQKTSGRAWAFQASARARLGATITRIVHSPAFMPCGEKAPTESVWSAQLPFFAKDQRRF